MIETLEEKSLFIKIINKIRFTDDCWIWTGASSYSLSTQSNYGCIRVGKQVLKVHRVFYKLVVDPFLSDRLDLDHLCRNTLCLNLDHLEPVSRSVNLTRGHGVSQHKTCNKGHPLTADNVLYSQGNRRCRICRNEWRRNNSWKYR